MVLSSNLYVESHHKMAGIVPRLVKTQRKGAVLELRENHESSLDFDGFNSRLYMRL